MRIPLREKAFVRLTVPRLQPGCSIPLSFFERTGALYLRCHVDEKVPNTHPVSGPCTNSVFPSPFTGGTEHRVRDRVFNRGSREVGHRFVATNPGGALRVEVRYSLDDMPLAQARDPLRRTGVYRDILSPRLQENADLVFNERAPS
jgi:hypothetical protein